MRLGSYRFPAEWQPESFTIPKADRYCASVKTYESAAVFSWGPDIIGKTILVEWDFVPVAVWDELVAMEGADAAVTWDPEKPILNAYLVEIMALEGKFFEVVNADGPYRRQVKLTLIILEDLGSGS